MHSTIPITVRVSVESLASLVQGLEMEGRRVRSKSDAVARAVDILAAYLVDKGATKFDTAEDAIAYMDMIGLPLGTNASIDKRLLRVKADEAMLLEGGRVEKPLTKKDLLERLEEGPQKRFADMTPEEQEKAVKRVLAANKNTEEED